MNRELPIREGVGALPAGNNASGSLGSCRRDPPSPWPPPGSTPPPPPVPPPLTDENHFAPVGVNGEPRTADPVRPQDLTKPLPVDVEHARVIPDPEPTDPAGPGPGGRLGAPVPPHPPAEPFDEGPPDFGTRDRHLPLMSGGTSRKGILCADDERILFLPDLHRILGLPA